MRRERVPAIAIAAQVVSIVLLAAQVTLQSLVADMSIATLDLRSGTTGGS